MAFPCGSPGGHLVSPLLALKAAPSPMPLVGACLCGSLEFKTICHAHARYSVRPSGVQQDIVIEEITYAWCAKCGREDTLALMSVEDEKLLGVLCRVLPRLPEGLRVPVLASLEAAEWPTARPEGDYSPLMLIYRSRGQEEEAPEVGEVPASVVERLQRFYAMKILTDGPLSFMNAGEKMWPLKGLLPEEEALGMVA